jgi:hypothetical protein
MLTLTRGLEGIAALVFPSSKAHLSQTTGLSHRRRPWLRDPSAPAYIRGSLGVNLDKLRNQQKLSLRSAASATSRLSRTKHLAAAGLFAYRIDVARRELTANGG